MANLPITIYEGMPIGQISFMRMDGPVEHPYGSARHGLKYQGQAEPTPSRFYLNFEGLRAGSRSYHECVTCRPIGPLEIIIVLVIVLVIFGPKRLPDLGRSLGTGMREFKDSVTGKDKDARSSRRSRPTAEKPEPTPTTAGRAPVLTPGGGRSRGARIRPIAHEDRLTHRRPPRRAAHPADHLRASPSASPGPSPPGRTT